jgi:formamidopyrimidine-DNA glycosylase
MMPEGPEARTVADKLRPYLVNRIITGYYNGERAKTIAFFNLKCPALIIGIRSYGKKVIGYNRS